MKTIDHQDFFTFLSKIMPLLNINFLEKNKITFKCILTDHK